MLWEKCIFLSLTIFLFPSFHLFSLPHFLTLPCSLPSFPPYYLSPSTTCPSSSSSSHSLSPLPPSHSPSLTLCTLSLYHLQAPPHSPSPPAVRVPISLTFKSTLTRCLTAKHPRTLLPRDTLKHTPTLTLAHLRRTSTHTCTLATFRTHTTVTLFLPPHTPQKSLKRTLTPHTNHSHPACLTAPPRPFTLPSERQMLQTVAESRFLGHPSCSRRTP